MTHDNWKWKSAPVEPGRAVVFDMDGVISNASGRQHHIENGDWDAFFESCKDDEVIHELARLLTLLQEDLTVVLLTARPLRVQPQTIEWLHRHELRWDLLCMRSENTISRTADYKRETVHQLREYGFDILIAFEDDRRNAEMFHSEGIPCVYIHSGYYE